MPGLECGPGAFSPLVQARTIFSEAGGSKRRAAAGFSDDRCVQLGYQARCLFLIDDKTEIEVIGSLGNEMNALLFEY